MTNIQCVLFDLDGTLVDTAPDLANALNTLLAAHNKPPLAFTRIREVVSQGGIAMIKLAFNITPEDQRFEPLKQQFLQLYQQQLYQHSRLFPGMENILQYLETHHILWGVVTNKPSWLTEPLLQGLNLTQRAACIVSGDTTAQSKPHPLPLLYACQQLSIMPKDCLYIGDAQRDIEAGKRANMMTLAALFGYLKADEDATQWQADAMINTPEEILAYL